MRTNFQVIIIGGGTAGIMTASHLRKKNKLLDIAIIEPSEIHFYQPAWTLVGAGAYDFNETAKPTSDVIPNGVTWIKDKAVSLRPDNNTVVLDQNGLVFYDYLIIATGLVMQPDKIKGLSAALERGIACSTYINPQFTWKSIRSFKGGNALFTRATSPIKSSASPQKIAYLACDYLRKQGISKKTNLVYATPRAKIFNDKKMQRTLAKVVARYGIQFRPFHVPKEIDIDNKVMKFQLVCPEGLEEECLEKSIYKEVLSCNAVVTLPFDLLHIAPPQAAPKFISESILANANGLLNVDHYSLQHNRHENIFGLGDVADLPTMKTGAAIRKQVPVVVHNLFQTMTENKKKKTKVYDGYSSCPVVTGYGKTALAEFNYANKLIPDPRLKRMLIFDSSKESWRLYMLKKYGFPYLYWNRMLKGEKF